MALSDMIESIRERIETGDKAQYILAGGLILIIAISLFFVISTLLGPNRPGTVRPEDAALHFWDVEQDKVVVLQPDEILPEEQAIPSIGIRLTNPHTGERTLIEMERCPSCKEYFLPEAYLEMDEMDYTGDIELVCPHCGTDINEYYRQKIRERRGR